MCEIPSNVVLADQFREIFDGFSIGSNDLTQLTLGLDRDSALVARLFDEQDPGVMKFVSMAIQGPGWNGRHPACAARRPATTRSSPSSWSGRASIRSPSTLTR